VDACLKTAIKQRGTCLPRCNPAARDDEGPLCLAWVIRLRGAVLSISNLRLFYWTNSERNFTFRVKPVTVDISTASALIGHQLAVSRRHRPSLSGGFTFGLPGGDGNRPDSVGHGPATDRILAAVAQDRSCKCQRQAALAALASDDCAGSLAGETPSFLARAERPSRRWRHLLTESRCFRTSTQAARVSCEGQDGGLRLLVHQLRQFRWLPAPHFGMLNGRLEVIPRPFPRRRASGEERS